MQILSDLHHSGLYNSLKITLEDRLHHKLYRPIGMSWADEYWKIHKPYDYNMDTARQYLDLHDVFTPKDGTPCLNEIRSANSAYYTLDERQHHYVQKALTLEQFADMDIDYIIASIPDHYVSFTKLRDRFHPKAKVICQAGNIGWNDPIRTMIREGVVKNLMASVAPFKVDCHSVFYHQELDTKVFTYKEPIVRNQITSFVIGLPQKEIFFQYQKALRGFNMEYWAALDKPFLGDIRDIARRMQDSTFIWQLKPMGDGFGHSWYGAGFCGRPLITNFSDYKDKLGAEIFEDNVTGIDLEAGTVAENVERIIKASSPDNHNAMCQAMNNKIKSSIDYAKEAQSIEQFLSACK